MDNKSSRTKVKKNTKNPQQHKKHFLWVIIMMKQCKSQVAHYPKCMFFLRRYLMCYLTVPAKETAFCNVRLLTDRWKILIASKQWPITGDFLIISTYFKLMGTIFEAADWYILSLCWTELFKHHLAMRKKYRTSNGLSRLAHFITGHVIHVVSQS